MDSVPHEHPFSTQSGYMAVLHTQDMYTLRNCSELQDDDINIQPSHQPEPLRETCDFLETIASVAATPQTAAPEAAAPEPGYAVQQNVQAEDIQFQFPTSVGDPGFVDESTNQLVLAHSSEVKPEQTSRSWKILVEPNLSWHELCARILPTEKLFNILSSYAYNLFKVPQLSALSTDREMGDYKIYRSPCNNFHIRVKRIKDGATGKDRKWRIASDYLQPGMTVVTGWFRLEPWGDMEIYNWDGQTHCPRTDCFEA
jgi:hypothetical protein